MALQAFLDSFAISTGIAGTTQARTGYGFQPKAVLVFGTRNVSAIDQATGADTSRSFGFATSTTSRRCISTAATDGAAAADTGRVSRNDAVHAMAAGDGTLSALMDISSIDADGVTFIIDDAYPVAAYAHVLALGGADITNVAVGDFTAATSGATQAITGVGFQPDALLIIGISTATAGNVATTDALFSLGVVSGTAAANNACLSGGSLDGADPTATAAYCLNGESVVGLANTPAINGRGYVSAFGADGFTISWNANPSAEIIFHYLAIKGGQFSVGDVLTQTDTTTDITESGVAFQPVAGLVISGCKAASSAGTMAASDETSIGAFTSATTEVATIMKDRNAVADSRTMHGVEFDSCYMRMTNTDGLDGAMHITAVNSDGYTARMADADPSQAFIAHLLFGSAAAGGSTPGKPWQQQGAMGVMVSM